ncbi:hypothetical protein HD554DRAFT_2178231 [Boletus coccyginus]|nr:hypothetical protein HD554DRAFT_2178231 [Boletus coccyginus]
MSSTDFPIHWQYPSSGPAPPSPVVVNTVPQYLGGRPTPPPTPPRPRAAQTVDDHAPCPPSPLYVPSSVDQDELEWLNALNAGTSSGPDDWPISVLDHCTSFADSLIDETPGASADQAPYDDVPHVSDCLIYDHEIYAYPSPMLAIIERATLDLRGLETQPVYPSACGRPLKLFSISAGCIPVTGLEKRDDQSLNYYAALRHSPPFREPECALSYFYPIDTIQTLQYELRTEWLSVYPEPIPPVIIRSTDLVGPYNLRRRSDGYAFVVPTDDSIWAIIRQRAVDSTYRPIDPLATVETGMCIKGAALYHPQHTVPPKFAVNVFLELPSPPGLPPCCEYLGAYVLKTMDGLTIDPSIWADIDPKVQQSVFDRVPDHFEGPRHPALGRPRLPCVQFCYYMWDQCVVGLADDLCDRYFLAWHDFAQWEAENESGYSDDPSVYSDSSFDIDQYCVDRDTASTPSVYSDEEGHESFLDLLLCE